MTKIIAGIIGLVIAAGGGFYGGILYAKGQAPARGQFMSGQFTGPNGARRAQSGGGFAAGEIITRDATSVTIKMQDGSTKIVLVSPSTQVTKSASGTLDDLSQGTNVVVTGTGNSDGSVTAESVQIRPTGTLPTSRERIGNQTSQ